MGGRHTSKHERETAADAAAGDRGEAPRERPVTRLESFSDGVFAISATLLVVTLDVPRTYADLVAGVRGFVAFGLSFAMLLLIWFAHNDYFRRFGLVDRTIALLNSALLFVVLFYVYPLKFLALSLVAVYSGRLEEANAMVSGAGEWVGLMTIYGAGFAAIFALLALMYRHAHRCRTSLGLTPREALDARVEVSMCWMYVGVALLSITLAQLRFGLRFGVPGWIYASIGPLSWWRGAQADRERKALPA
ncbi:MAG TPA: TMEM175 family protein [Planctomycetota bacterium]|nr:TMEM175 family protein [Planctomycetota bacterium]